MFFSTFLFRYCIYQYSELYDEQFFLHLGEHKNRQLKGNVTINKTVYCNDHRLFCELRKMQKEEKKNNWNVFIWPLFQVQWTISVMKDIKCSELWKQKISSCSWYNVQTSMENLKKKTKNRQIFNGSTPTLWMVMKLHENYISHIQEYHDITFH